MEIKAIIFDLDGTLLDSIEDLTDAGNKMLENHGFPGHPVENYVKWIGEGASMLIKRAMPQDIEFTEEDFKQHLSEFRDIYYENIAVKSRLYKGIPEMLDRLENAGIPVAILSNKPHYMVEKLKGIFLEKWDIKPVFGQREDVPRKPDPAGAIEIAEILGLDPAGIMFVGDSTVDLQTAKGAGMQPLCVNWGYKTEELLKEAGCSNIAGHPAEIANLVIDN